MSLAPGWRRLFRLPLTNARSLEREVDDELAFHLAMREEKLRGVGMSPESAHATAVSRFGDRAAIRDECLTIDQQYAREVRLMEWIESVWSDFRYALRTLTNAPVFTAVAVATLALGIGATSAMFSLVDGILLRPLPFPHADRLVRVLQSFPEKGLDDWSLSQENLAMYRDRSPDFSAFAGYARRAGTLTGVSRPERLVVEIVTGNFFTVLGVTPALGRAILPEDDQPHQSGVAVLSHGFWQTHFPNDSSIVGKTLDIDGAPVRVVGVMPRGFGFPRSDVQLWRPVGLDPTRKFGWFLTGIGRLAPNASAAHAERQTTAIMWDWAREAPGLLAANAPPPERTQMKTLVVPLRTAITGDSARPLAVLQAAVLVILLIAIANVATLLSSRAAGRRREIALRGALGATKRRVVRQLLTESITLAAIGAIIGTALAAGFIHTFAHANAMNLPRIDEVGVNGEVLAFTLVVTMISGILFGLAPAFHTTGGRLTDDLGGQRDSGHRATRRMNNGLVIAQLGLSVVLLVSAGLVLESFQRLLETNLGFDPRHVTSIALPLPQPRYSDQNRAATFATSLARQVSDMPGVRSAAIVFPAPPFSNNVNTDGYLIEGRAPSTAAGSETQTVTLQVSPGYFNTLRIPLLRGRDFTASDRAGSVPVVIVDSALAARYWALDDAIGKRMRLSGDTTWLTIVGVVGSVRDEDVATGPRPHSYFSALQQPATRFVLAVSTNGDASPTIAAVRRTIAQLEPAMPLDGIRPLADSISDALDSRRVTELLLAGFAMLAVTLATVGIYGVMSLYVANRKREFGIRLAIGAEPSRLVRSVLGEGAALAVAGVGLGVAGALLATRWVGSLLYGVSATDPVVYAVLSIALFVLAIASCYVPARRAAKSDPLSVIRAD